MLVSICLSASLRKTFMCLVLRRTAKYPKQKNEKEQSIKLENIDFVTVQSDSFCR